MPPKHRSPIPEELVELAPAVQRLAELVQVLSTSLDDLTQEIQWQNRELSPRDSPTHLPLTRLPLDPTTKNWRPEWGRPSEPTSAEQPVPSPTQIEQLSRSVKGLSHEIARIEQIAAMLVIASCGEELTEQEATAWDAVLHWAYEQFDAESLHESIPEFFGESVSYQPAPEAHSPPPQPGSFAGKRQHKLFAEEPADDSDKSSPQ
jgi:hypothetical protein